MTLTPPASRLRRPRPACRRACGSAAQWLPGGGIPVTDPSTGAALAEVADAGVAEAMAAVDAAEAAAAGWRATPPRQRSEILRRMFTRMTEEAEALAHLIALENGKALPDARGEVAYAAEFFRWYAEEATRIPGEFRHTPSGSHNILVDHEPIGISRPDHAVELPCRDGDPQDRPGARRWLHGDPETRLRDAR